MPESPIKWSTFATLAKPTSDQIEIYELYSCKSVQCNDNIAAGSIFNNLIQSFDREEVDPRASTNPLLGIFLSGSGRAGEGDPFADCYQRPGVLNNP